MNPRIKIFNDIREDISDYLFHFTKGEDALFILDKIINDGAIKDVIITAISVSRKLLSICLKTILSS